MKRPTKLITSLFIVLSVASSCSQHHPTDNLKNRTYVIKSIIANGKTSSKFFYNENAKLFEVQSFYMHDVFTYDTNGRLIKHETAFDPDVYSSSSKTKSELMSAQNSSFNAKETFEYGRDGKLKTKKHYSLKNNSFEFTSMNTFEYEGDKIVKWNLLDEKNTIMTYNTFIYDSKGNVINDKYYSCHSNSGPEPKLITEVTYTYDDKNNPYRVYKDLAQPGFYTNPNNIIEIKHVLYEDDPNVDQVSTSKTVYDYNDLGFPIKVDHALEYRYE